ncbi:MAG: bacterial transcriptional activator domain-containing protein [Acidimicrobiales bacterium]|nr:bacterial transcriptional activator domain-containing protein [Acidimicrobiales bacterium]
MVRVFLTGRLTVVGADGSFDEADLPGTQGRVAFAALALHHDPLARDDLADLVWDNDTLPGAWSQALNSIVSKVRRLLTSIGVDGRAALRQVGGSYQLVVPSDWWIDAEDAVRRLDRAEGAARHGDWKAAATDATVAASIFRRPFLTGSEGLWVERERARLRNAQYRSHEVLAESWIEQHDPGLAATIARQAIELDPLRESAYRLAIRAELARGDRAAAALVFRRCEQTLRDELGITPSADTRHLRDQLGP